ncbi:MAG: benzodiazapine receptor [Candidatus Paceibacteria bacterium]|jgi:benzodiazapine receptor
MNTYDWYQALEKPFFAPPSSVFGVTWGIIYPLIAIAFIILLFEVYNTKKIPKELVGVFVLNMIGNFMFTPVQFGLQSNILAFFVICYVLLTLYIFEKKIAKYSKVIFYLMFPYLIWTSFAALLQLTITIMNL